MGTISQGVLGGFSGKIGNIVGGTWKGIDYMRIKPANVANPRTPGQLDQRSKFALVLNFLQPMTEFLRVGYKLYAIKMTEFNSAMSFILFNAVSGDYPDYAIDYSKALVSKGNLTSAQSPTALATSPGKVAFSWVDNTGNGFAAPTDKALLLLYNPAKKEAVYTTAGATRSSGGQELSIPLNYEGDLLEAFIGFISADNKSVANSVYVGSVLIT